MNNLYNRLSGYLPIDETKVSPSGIYTPVKTDRRIGRSLLPANILLL